MPGRIRQEDIAAVRERSPIADVVGEYLQLRSAGGGSLKGLCPFHDEKTPSFNVTPSRGLWYCFSCTEGGDVIKFVQRIDNLSFTEAVERLAARAGIDRPTFKQRVRRLKALGLTESLEVGYRLSPRGEAVLADHAPRV